MKAVDHVVRESPLPDGLQDWNKNKPKEVFPTAASPIKIAFAIRNDETALWFATCFNVPSENPPFSSLNSEFWSILYGFGIDV